MSKIRRRPTCPLCGWATSPKAVRRYAWRGSISLGRDIEFGRGKMQPVRDVPDGEMLRTTWGLMMRFLVGNLCVRWGLMTREEAQDRFQTS